MPHVILLEESFNRHFLYRNVFATKLYMEWSSTAWVLARYSAQRHEGEMEVVNEEYPESVPHFV